MDWASFSLSDIAPDDFVRFSGRGRPDLSNVSRVGVAFRVNTQGLGCQYVEMDNFSVPPDPPMVLTLGNASAYLGGAVFRRRRRLRGKCLVQGRERVFLR
jgi:hypothetical protein